MERHPFIKAESIRFLGNVPQYILRILEDNDEFVSDHGSMVSGRIAFLGGKRQLHRSRNEVMTTPFLIRIEDIYAQTMKLRGYSAPDLLKRLRDPDQLLRDNGMTTYTGIVFLATSGVCLIDMPDPLNTFTVMVEIEQLHSA